MKFIDFFEYIVKLGPVLLTAALAWFTWLLYKETEKTRIQNATPQISVYFFPIMGDSLGIKIKNTGHIDAKNINIKCLNNNRYILGNDSFIYAEKLSKFFSYIPPQQGFSFFVGMYEILKNEILKFEISFTNMTNEIKIYYYIEMDMDLLRGIFFEVAPEERIADLLERKL